MNTTKKTYQVPHMNRVELDNEISLILASGNEPMGDPEGFSMNLTETTLISSNPINSGII